MAESFNIEEHANLLGRLVSNIQSLELVLRDFLLTDIEGLSASIDHAKRLEDFKVGQLVEANPFTNYDDLTTIIKKYNQRVEKRASRFCVDAQIVEIRDIIAHGRVFSYVPSPPHLLMKFGREVEGQVKVVFSEWMTNDWFDKQIKRVSRELQKITEAGQLFHSSV